MLVVPTLSLLLGLALTADRPQPLAQNDCHAARSCLREDAPPPSESGRPARDRLRAHFEDREKNDFRARPATADEAAPPAVRSHRLCRGSPRASGPSADPLFRTFCALLC